MTSSRDPFAQPLFTPRVLWLAMMVSNVMAFAAVAFTTPPADVPPDPVFVGVLCAVALFVAVVSVVLPARLKKRAVAATQLAITEAADPNASVIFRESTPRIRVFADTQDVAATGGRVMLTPLILGLGLADAIGLYGVVLVALGLPVVQAAAFPAVAAVLMARLFPTRNALLAPLEAHYGARVASDQPANNQ